MGGKVGGEEEEREGESRLTRPAAELSCGGAWGGCSCDCGVKDEEVLASAIGIPEREQEGECEEGGQEDVLASAVLENGRPEHEGPCEERELAGTEARARCRREPRCKTKSAT